MSSGGTACRRSTAVHSSFNTLACTMREGHAGCDDWWPAGGAAELQWQHQKTHAARRTLATAAAFFSVASRSAFTWLLCRPFMAASSAARALHAVVSCTSAQQQQQQQQHHRGSMGAHCRFRGMRLVSTRMSWQPPTLAACMLAAFSSIWALTTACNAFSNTACCRTCLQEEGAATVAREGAVSSRALAWRGPHAHRWLTPAPLSAGA